MQFLITAIIAAILLVGVASSCPSVCCCTDTSHGVVLYCNNKGLYSIPTDLPNNTFDLHIQHNSISVLEDNTFNNLPRVYRLKLYYNNISVIAESTFNNLPSLGYILLYHNQITSIQSGTFNGVPSLVSLQLQNNYISVIEDNVFRNLPRLYFLYLNYNKITSIQAGAFDGLPRLNVLYLHNNDISVIEENVFNNITTLTYLELQYNAISVIENNSFNNLPNLRYLTMNNNTISLVSENALENLPRLTTLKFDMYCGCGSIPFWGWLKRNQQFSLSVTCNDYKGEYLYNLQPNNSTDCFDACDREFDFCTNTSGCNRGWQPGHEKCNLASVSGKCGDKCTQTCHCMIKPCDPIAGTCPPGGSQRGYTGRTCSRECATGTYGFNCESRCDTCVANICETRDGN